MDTAATHGHGNTVPRELSSEQEEQKEQNEAFQAEVPEGAMATAWAGWLAYGASSYFNKKIEIFEAFKHVNDPNFKYDLLNVSDPAKYEKAAYNLQVVQREVEKERKKKSKKGEVKGSDTVNVSVLPFKRFSQSISFDAFAIKEQQFQLAETVQNKLSDRQADIKQLAASKEFGLNLKNHNQLNEELKDWRKFAPNANIEDFLNTRGQSLHLEQKLDPQLQGEQKGIFAKRKKENAINALARKEKNELKKRSDKLFNAFAEVRSRVLDANSATIEDLHVHLAELEKGAVSKEELEKRKQQLLNPGSTGIKTELKEETKLQPAADKIVHEEAQAPTGPITAKAPLEPPQSPIKAEAITLNNPIQKNPILAPNFPPVSSSTVTRNFNFKIMGKSFGIPNFISSGVTKLGGKLAGKAAIKLGGQALASILPFIGNAAMLLLQITGLDEKLIKWGIYAALFVVAVPVGLIILMMTSPQIKDAIQQSSPIPTPIKVSINNNSNNNLSYDWQDFEKNVLGESAFRGHSCAQECPQTSQSLADPQISDAWEDFEKKFLGLNPDGHDDM